MARVSVIIPVYNTEHYLDATIQCIRQQTLRDIQIIVVDDGSTDRSPEIAESHAAQDPRIRIVAQPNQGQAVARNTGLGAATGEYIYFMDSDDLLDADALEKCVEKCDADKLDFVFFDADMIIEQGAVWDLGFDYVRTTGLQDRVYDGTEMLDIQYNEWRFRAQPCLMLIERTFLMRSGLRFYPGIIHEDELFTTMIYLFAERVGLIPRAFFHRRVRSGSTMTNRFSRRNMTGYFAVFSSMQRYCKSLPERKSAVLRKCMTRAFNAALRRARAMNFKDRMWVLGKTLRGFCGIVSAKSLIGLFIPLKSA